MFDLFRSRDKAVRILLGGLLVLVALSMLTYLIPSYDTGGGPTGTVVAQVGNEKITLTDVQRQIQATMRGKQLPPEIIPNYIPQMVEGMVTERALAYEAQRMGFQIGDEDLRQYLMTLPGLYQDGRFVGKDVYAAMLAQQELTIPEFEAGVRRQMLVTRLRDVAVEGSVVTPLEIEQAFKQKNDKVKFEYVKFADDQFKKEVTPTEAEMKEYYRVNSASYKTPEKKNLVILVADQAKLEQTLKPDDAELLKIYNQNKDQYRVPERVQVQHILFMTQGKPASDDAKIKAQAEDVLNQIRKGANFDQMVEKYSEDPGKTNKAPAPGGNGIYWVQRDGQMVPEFEKAAFSQKVGEVEMVKAQSTGYHIIKVLKHEDAHVQTFDEVKDQIASQWKKQQVNALLQNASDKAQAELAKDPTHPEKVAAEFHMDIIHADDYEAGKPVADLGSTPDFDQAIAGLKQGQVSPPVTVGANKLVVAEVTAVTPSRPSTFEEVQNQIRDTMIQNRLKTAVRKHAQDLLDKAKAEGGDLDKAAKEAGAKAATTDAVTRNDTVAGLGSATYLTQGFQSADGALLGPIVTPEGTFVVKVLQHVPADMSKLPAERATIRDTIKSQKARDRDTLFEAGVRDALIKQGKIKINQEVINRLIAQYRAG
jgi:peptidyl-prolyl cis-trans isomerase D